MTLNLSTAQKQTASTLLNHNVMVNGRRTSVRLEKEMWLALKDVAKRESCTVHDVVSEIAKHKRTQTSLTAAIRVLWWHIFKQRLPKMATQKLATAWARMCRWMILTAMLTRLITAFGNLKGVK